MAKKTTHNPEHYAVYYNGTWIEMTPRVCSEKQALAYVKKRYNSLEGVTVKPQSPVIFNA